MNDLLDPHVHFWDPATTPRAVTPLVRWLGFSPRLVDAVARVVFPRDAAAFFATPEHVTRAYLPASYAADARASGGGFVHVEAGWEGDPVDETRWVEGLRQQGAPIEAIVARADLSKGAAVAEVLLAHLQASDRVRGIRDTVSWHPDPGVLDGGSRAGMMADPTWRAGFAQLARFGLHFEATCYDHQLGELLDLARSFPEQPIVLCHLGTPIGLAGAFANVGTTADERRQIRERWEENLTALAACPNVTVKLSGLLMPCCGFGFERRLSPPTPAEVADALQPYVDFVIDAFGADRCMFASNFPVDKVSIDHATLFAAYRRIAAPRSAAAQRALFSGTARAVYGIAMGRSKGACSCLTPCYGRPRGA